MKTYTLQFCSEEVRRMENHALPHVHPRQLDRIRMSTISAVPPTDPSWKNTHCRSWRCLAPKVWLRRAAYPGRGTATPAKDGREIFEGE